MEETKYGTFEELLAGAEPEVRPIAERLREIILGIDPESVEVVRLGDRAATYGVGPKKMSEGYAYIMPQKSWVNLGFYKGAALPDPENVMEGTGKSLRHVKVRSTADAERPEVQRLIEEAFAERQRALRK
jgi:hypothetical protein